MKFLDICSGIGGGHLGVSRAFSNAECIGFSEIDATAIKIYQNVFPSAKYLGSVEEVTKNKMEYFDLLIAGFPCQSFSINGKRKGFDGKQGSVFLSILKIIKNNFPKYILLENVKGLSNHDGGETLNYILQELTKLGYAIKTSILNSKNFGVPQSRERLYIFCCLDLDVIHDFEFKDVLHDERDVFEILPSHLFNKDIKTLCRRCENKKYNNISFQEIITNLEEGQIIDFRQSDIRIYKNTFPTLRAGKHGILYVKSGILCSLDHKNSLRLQGFTENFINKVSEITTKNKLMFYSGNAMTVNVIFSIFKQLVVCIQKKNKKR